MRKNERPLVSIVMPIYNGEFVIQNTINQWKNQTLSNFELILIDDGSTDNSLLLCNKNEKEDSRIKVVHKKNSGVSSTRNLGIEIANGEYLVFSDQDDNVKSTLLEDNYNYAEKYEVNVVKFGSVYRTIKTIDSPNELIIQKNELFKKYLTFKKQGILANCWNGFYRTSFLHNNKILFDTDLKFGGDDQIFNLNLINKSDKILVNPNIYYYWNVEADQHHSTKFNVGRIYEMYQLFQKQYSILSSKLPDEDIEEIIKELAFLNWQRGIQELFHVDCSLVKKDKIKILREISDSRLYRQWISFKGINLLNKKGIYRFVFITAYKLNFFNLFAFIFYVKKKKCK